MHGGGEGARWDLCWHDDHVIEPELPREPIKCWWGGAGWSRATAECRAREYNRDSQATQVYHSYCDTDDNIGRFWVRPIKETIRVSRRQGDSRSWGISFMGIPQVVTETIDGITRGDDPRYVP